MLEGKFQTRMSAAAVLMAFRRMANAGLAGFLL
jgi:hypothetical protein